MSFLSTPQSVESVSFARVVRLTSAVRVCTSLLQFEISFMLTRSQVRATQGQGLMPDKTSRFTVRGQPVLHFVWFPSFTLNPSVSLTVASVDGDLDVLSIHSCRRRICRRCQPRCSFGKGLPPWMWYYHRLGRCRQTTGSQGFYRCCLRLRLHRPRRYQCFHPRGSLSYYRYRYKLWEGSLG